MQLASKWAAADAFLQSRVKDTSAARTMARRLIENGYGIEHLLPVYMAAWSIRGFDPACTSVYRDGVLVTNDPPGLQQLRQEIKEEQIQKLISLGITDQAMLEQLLSIRPMVAWSTTTTVQQVAPTPREPWADGDAAVIDYMDRTPINDPAGHERYGLPSRSVLDAINKAKTALTDDEERAAAALLNKVQSEVRYQD